MQTWQSTDIPISVKMKMAKMYVFTMVNIDFVMFKLGGQVVADISDEHTESSNPKCLTLSGNAQ